MPGPPAGLGMLEEFLRRSARLPRGHGAANRSPEMTGLLPAPGMTVFSWALHRVAVSVYHRPEIGGDAMAKKPVAELLVETLVSRGVSRIYGVAGDSLNGITDAIRRQDQLRWIPVRHEETAAFAAGAEAHLTGHLAVCAGSCGPGNMHLINGLYDCHRSRVPVLALAAQIPSQEIGSNYFQETHPDQLFRDCSDYCELISQTTQVPRVLEIAIQTALTKKGVAVVAIPGDIALLEAEYRRPSAIVKPANPIVYPSGDEIQQL